MKGISVVLSSLVFFIFFGSTALAAKKPVKKVLEAVEVVEAVTAMPEKGLPDSLLKKAKGIAIIPGVIKVGFVIGGRFGRGVFLVKRDGGWSNPVFVTITGASLGYQIGAQSTDIVLVFMSKKGVDGIVKGKFTLGADASVAAGPVGRHAEAATDIELKAEIYSYSRSRGLFAGVSLEGAVISIDDESNEAFYGMKEIMPREILEGRVKRVPSAAIKLKRLLSR